MHYFAIAFIWFLKVCALRGLRIEGCLEYYHKAEILSCIINSCPARLAGLERRKTIFIVTFAICFLSLIAQPCFIVSIGLIPTVQILVGFEDQGEQRPTLSNGQDLYGKYQVHCIFITFSWFLQINLQLQFHSGEWGLNCILWMANR